MENLQGCLSICIFVLAVLMLCLDSGRKLLNDCADYFCLKKLKSPATLREEDGEKSEK